jgi:protein-S-isoprenylcysteine O-methyltransferase Ste14
VTQLDLIADVSLAVCWAAFAVTWLAGAIVFERNAPPERTRSRFGSSFAMGTVIVLIVILAVPKPDWRSVLIDTPWVRLLGLAIVLASTAFAIWARLTLGAMWSAAPTVKEHHALQTRGPYRLVLLEIKIHVEERLMLAEFPDDYPRYREQVPQLIPGLRLPRRRPMAAE